MQQTHPQFPPALQERYKKPRFISAGGAGAVYAAHDKNLNKQVAIKLLSVNSGDQKLLRFQQEAKVIAKFNHSNIVKALDFGIVDETIAYLVLDLVGDGSLNTLIQKKVALPIKKCLDIFRQICAGMSYAHEHGVLHRDLKPSNVLLENSESEHPTAKVADFGIAKISGTLILATTGNIYIGTPAYTSPEQFSSNEVDQRSDIYSFGCLMFATLHGTTPFQGNNTTELALKHTSDPVPSIEQTYRGEPIPPLLQEIVQTCLAKQPNARYESFAEVEELIVQVQKDCIGPQPDFRKQQAITESLSVASSSNPYCDTSEGLPFQLKDGRTFIKILAAATLLAVVIGGVICTSLLRSEIHPLLEQGITPTTLGITEYPDEKSMMDSKSGIFNSQSESRTVGLKLPETMLNKPIPLLFKNAQNQMVRHHYSNAISYFDRIIKLQPDNVQALKLRCDCKRNLKNYSGALFDVSTAMAIKPDDVKLILRRAHLRQQTEDLNGALDDFNNFLKIKPDSPMVYKDQAKTLERLEQYDAAIAAYTKGIAQDPHDDGLFRERARLHNNSGHFQKALNDFSQAIALNPINSENYGLRANTYITLKQYQKAVDDCSKAIELEHNISGFYHLRAYAYDKLGQTKLANQDRARSSFKGLDIN